MTAPVRAPAVAGRFYPAAPALLARTLDELLANGRGSGIAPKAIVAPHAGYVYSGPVAASVYARLEALRSTVERVVLCGPAHHLPVLGCAIPSVDALRTPLGDVPVDSAAREQLLGVPGVAVDDAPHAPEHSLEVHLPFLQRVFERFTVVPLVFGRMEPDAVAAVLDAVWGGAETLIVVSTDLSHYEAHESAVAHDVRTVEAIMRGDLGAIGTYDACGAVPLRGLLLAAHARRLRPLLLDRRTSGDTAGTHDRVVGYVSLAFTADS